MIPTASDDQSTVHTAVAEGNLEVIRAHRDAEDEYLRTLFDRLSGAGPEDGWD